MVFAAGGDVPEGGVEDDAGGRDWELEVLVQCEEALVSGRGDTVYDVLQKVGWLKSMRPAIVEYF